MSRTHLQSILHAALFLALVGVLAALQTVLDSKTVLSGLAHNLLYDICINIILGLGLTLILGMTGQFSIGHAGFLSAGAFTAVVIAGHPELFLPQLHLWHDTLHLSGPLSFTLIFLTAAAAAVLVAALLGFVVGLPALRLRGDYLAIATLGFGEILAVIITNSEYLGAATGASLFGLRSIWAHSPQADAQPLAVALVNSNLFDTPYLISSFWVLLGALFTLYVVRNIKYSTSGRSLLAVREDEIASEAVGVPTTRYKVSAFIIGAALAGLAGALLAHHKTVNPSSFTFLRSVEIILIVILGGQGSLSGCILSAILITLLPEALRSGIPLSWNINADLIEKWRLVIYSLLIIFAMLFRPQGLFGRFEITDLIFWLTHLFRRSPLRPTRAFPLEIPPGLPTLAAENENDPATVPLLVASSITMQFGGLKAVDNFNLTLLPGELVGLIGPNGAGKTSVFNALTGVYRPASGQISFASRSTLGLRPHAISRIGLARTFQNIRLFANLSVLDNVQIAQHMHHHQGMPTAILRTPAFYREEEISRRNALGYLDLFGLAHLARHRANSLAYGDQRRLEIARALATRPKLLLLDEPAAGMNPTEKRQLMEMIINLRARFGLTILIIEHDMKVIMGVCQRILVLDYGKTIASGTPEHIRKNPAVIQAYLGASTKQG